MMKKIFFLFAICLCSCSNDKSTEGLLKDDIENVEISITALKGDFDSRVSYDTNEKIYKWVAEDTVGIFPNKGGQVEFAITEESYGKTKAEFDGGGWALRSNYKYSAYYPFNFYNRDAKNVLFSYVGQKQKGNNNQDHVGDYTLLIASPTSSVGGTLTFAMSHVGYILGVTMELPANKTYTSLSLYADDKIIPVKRSYNLLSETLQETDVEYSESLSVSLENIATTETAKKIRVWMAFPFMNNADKTLTAVVTDSQNCVYVGNVMRSGAPFTFKGLERHLAYSLTATPVQTTGVSAGIEDWEIGEEILGSAE